MKKVKNCIKLVPFFARDGRLRPKWTLFILFVHYFKNTHSNHSLPLIRRKSICSTINSIIYTRYTLLYEYADIDLSRKIPPIKQFGNAYFWIVLEFDSDLEYSRMFCQSENS